MADSLTTFLITHTDVDLHSLHIPEGTYKGWVPRAIYSMELHGAKLPFLRLLNFPVGGTALGKLSQTLTIFEAVGNYLSKLPLCFAECQCLTKLDLSFNHFFDIPVPVYQLVCLEQLNLAHNDITHMDPAIGQLKNLKILDLSGNLLSEVPNELRKCRKLQELYLSGKFYPRGLLTKIPDCVYSLKELVVLDLSWQKISHIPPELSNLRKLREIKLRWNLLQSVSREMKKCAKLQLVDLAGALRLMYGIPAALFHLEDLQSLQLSDNYFTDIPTEVHGLVMLKSLSVHRNSLLRLSEDLYKLRYLESLDLNENMLREIPRGINSLKRLRYLSLDKNELTELPSEICGLDQLEVFIVGHNKLKKLPEKIYELQNLRVFNLNDNQLTEVPLLMDRMEKLGHVNGLDLVNNPLRSPFKEMSLQGTQALFAFLKGVRMKEAQHRWKMILIGSAKAGKTSLRRALMYGRSQLTEDSERTWVMERHLWEPQSRLRVQILDFGGHHIYQAAHQLFLSPDALHIVVFDLTKYSTDHYDDLIGHWMDAIMDKAAGAQIVLVGTHSDCCSEEDIDEKVEDIQRLLKRIEGHKRAQIEKQLKRLDAELNKPDNQEGSSGGISDLHVDRLRHKHSRLEKLLHTRSKIPEIVHIVSCADNLTGMDDLRYSLMDRLTSTAVTTMPDTWFQFLDKIQAVPEKVVPFEKALILFEQIMSEEREQSQLGIGFSLQKTLHSVLRYLHLTGEIVWYEDNPDLKPTIFHHPETLVDMLRAVFRHDFDTAVYYQPEIVNCLSASGDADRNIVSEQEFDKMKKSFLSRGLLTKELLHYLLIHFQLSQDFSNSLVDLVVSLMLKFGLCFEIKGTTRNALMGSSRIVQFPWFFPEDRPENLESSWPTRLPFSTFEIRVEFRFSGLGPPNYFEKLLVRIHTEDVATDLKNWKNGIYAERNRSKLLVIRNKIERHTVVTVAARGQSDLQELWGLVKKLHSVSLQLFQDWPLLKRDVTLVCLHCLLLDEDDPYHYPEDVLEQSIPSSVYTMRQCCERRPDDSIPTCFVFPLYETNLQENHQEHMAAATEFLHKHLYDRDDVDEGITTGLSDRQVAYIASHICSEWPQILVMLGMTKARLDQITTDYPLDTYQRIRHSLFEWRDSISDHLSPQDKLNALLTVLASEEVQRRDIVEALTDR